MEASTTINRMLAGNKIFVSACQRAYSWDTPSKDNPRNLKTQTDMFFQDLLDYNQSSALAPYYLGHFLFEENGDSCYGVIDGQQRLTTIVILLSALYSKLKTIRSLTDEEMALYENMIKRKSNYIFSTVDYDNQLFKDYVIDQTKKDKHGLETESARRIVKAFDYFTNAFADKDEQFLTRMLKIVAESNCTVWVYSKTDYISLF